MGVSLRHTLNICFDLLAPPFVDSAIREKMLNDYYQFSVHKWYNKFEVKIRIARTVSMSFSYFHRVRSVLLFCRKSAISRAVSPAFLAPSFIKKGDEETYSRRRKI